jgi:hypothetical protein
MKQSNSEQATKLLRKILIICLKKNIDFGVQQEGDKLEGEFFDKDPKYLHFNIPVFDDKDKTTVKFLSDWLKKLKTIP